MVKIKNRLFYTILPVIFAMPITITIPKAHLNLSLISFILIYLQGNVSEESLDKVKDSNEGSNADLNSSANNSSNGSSTTTNVINNNGGPLLPAPNPQTTPKRLHVSNIPFRFRDPDLRNMFGVSLKFRFSPMFTSVFFYIA